MLAGQKIVRIFVGLYRNIMRTNLENMNLDSFVDFMNNKFGE